MIGLPNGVQDGKAEFPLGEIFRVAFVGGIIIGGQIHVVVPDLGIRI